MWEAYFRAVSRELKNKLIVFTVAVAFGQAEFANSSNVKRFFEIGVLGRKDYMFEFEPCSGRIQKLLDKRNWANH